MTTQEIRAKLSLFNKVKTNVEELKIMTQHFQRLEKDIYPQLEMILEEMFAKVENIDNWRIQDFDEIDQRLYHEIRYIIGYSAGNYSNKLDDATRINADLTVIKELALSKKYTIIYDM